MKLLGLPICLVTVMVIPWAFPLAGQEVSVEELRAKAAVEVVDGIQLYLLEHLAAGGTMENIREPDEATKQEYLSLPVDEIQLRARKASSSMNRQALEAYFVAFVKARGRVQQVSDLHQMRQLIVACLSYAADENSKFPDDLDVLVGDYLADDNELKKLTRLSCGQVVYVSGLGSDSPGHLILFHSPPTAEGKILVGRVDGSALALSKEDFEKAFDKTKWHILRSILDEAP